MANKRRAKRIFIAATMQNGGKTTFSLGLIFALKKYFKRIGFIKPIGQRYLIEHGYKIDEDSVLIEEICGMKYKLRDMSPVAIERGFTESYIKKPDKKRLTDHILSSFNKIEKRSDLVIIEGTGHAGVGSVFGLSNAAVAKLLDSQVIIISGGGIGKPIDEIVLNQALFDKEQVPVTGVIVNKVLPSKFRKVKGVVSRGLKNAGLDVLGVVPYNPILDTFTVKEVHEETGWPVVCGEKFLSQRVSKIIVGAMEVHDALNHIENSCLLITPGDREDILMGITLPYLVSGQKRMKIAGVILSGGIVPHRNVIGLLKKVGVPVLLSGSDTYQTVSKVYNLTVKIKPENKDKINTIVKTVKKNVDIKKIVDRL